MVTAADTVTFQQQLRREVPEIIHKVRTERNETVGGRIGMLNGGTTAFRSTSDLRLWMQAWSDDGETMLVSVESSDKFDTSTLSKDCAGEEFRTIEASLFTKYCTAQQQLNH